MDPINFPLSVHQGHLLLHGPSGAWVLDTGAPGSFGVSPPPPGLAKASVDDSYIGLDAETLGGFLGIEVVGLLGADLLGGQDLALDCVEGRVEVGHLDPDPGAVVVPVRWFMGIPIVDVTVARSSHALFFDTGAPISYLQRVELEEYPTSGTLDDFYPGFGPFQTEAFRVPLGVGDVCREVRCGRLPGLLGMSLMLGGVTGILGTEFILGRRTVLSYPRSTLSLSTPS